MWQDPGPRAQRMDASFLASSLRNVPSPMSFMPMTPLPASAAFFRMGATFSAGPSILVPNALARAWMTSTQGHSAAASRASVEWHDTPWARITPLAFRFSRMSICRFCWSVHFGSVMQWIWTMSR